MYMYTTLFACYWLYVYYLWLQFSEPVIDKLRLEKDNELERYRKASERKMRELEKQALQDGIVI